MPAADYGDFAILFLPWHSYGTAPEEFDGETALIRGKTVHILNGDWTREYSELAPQGYDACYAFFQSKFLQFGSRRSAFP